jgi:hypothetical protein
VSTQPAKPTAATGLVNLVLNTGVELFHDAQQVAYATLPDGRTLELESDAFSEWLAREFYNETQGVTSSTALTDAIASLVGSAKYGGETHPVYVRVAAADDVVWLDLGHDVVRITAEGWEQRPASDAGVRFVRHQGSHALPTPVPTPAAELAGMLEALTNVRAADIPLALAWLTCALRGRSPFPVLQLTGNHGTAKSYGTKVLRSILDPNVAPLRSTPRDERDLLISAGHSLITTYDNLSTIPSWLSDVLCCLSTGSGFATRKLHSNATEVIFSMARPVLFNSITDVINRPDLLDRTLILSLDPILDEDRRTEKELNARFAAAHPRILGALLDAVSIGMQHEGTITLPRLPRMADFALWAEAVAPAFGWPPHQFLDQYDQRRQNASDDLLSNDAIFEALQALPTPWEGTSTALLELVTTRDRRFLKDWPQTPGSLTGRLRRLQPSLKDVGIEATYARRHRSRTWRITRLHEQPDLADL